MRGVELAQAAGGAHDPEEVARALGRVVLRTRGADSNPLERLSNWVADHLIDLLPGGKGDLLFALFVLVAALVLARLGLVVARTLGSRRRPARRGEPASGPSPLEVARELFARARAERAQGRSREALRSFLHALVLTLGGRGVLEFRPAWTLRELIARGSPAEEARALLDELVLEFEPKDFGDAPIREEDLDRLEEACASALGGAR